MARAAAPPVSRRARWLAGPRLLRYAEKLLIYLILLSGGVLVLIPLWWMVSTSIKQPKEVFLFPPTFWPEAIQWRNYVDIFEKAPFERYILNTVFIVIMDLIGTLWTASMVGYAFARLRWRGRDLLFLITLATMMLPGAVTMIPRYLIFNELQWLDSFRPL